MLLGRPHSGRVSRCTFFDWWYSRPVYASDRPTTLLSISVHCRTLRLNLHFPNQFYRGLDGKRWTSASKMWECIFEILMDTELSTITDESERVTLISPHVGQCIKFYRILEFVGIESDCLERPWILLALDDWIEQPDFARLKKSIDELCCWCKHAELMGNNCICAILQRKL